MAQDHDHSKDMSEKNLAIAFFLNFIFAIIEFIGGYMVNSVSIVSDALHDLGDSLSLATAWYLQKKSKKKANTRFTFGYARLSLLGALLNSVILIVGSIFVLYRAIERLYYPEPTDAEGMMMLAILGVAVNGYAAWRVSHGTSLNERVVAWHFIEDLLGWIAVLTVSIILRFQDNYYIDPILSILITLYILYGVSKRLKETITIFLQSAPSGIDIDKIENEILQIEHVESVHHIHSWTLSGEDTIFTCHVVLKDIYSVDEIREVKMKIKTILAENNIEHATIETELPAEPCAIDPNLSH